MNHMTSVRLDDSVFVFVKVLFSVACTFLHPHLISYCAFFVLYCLYMATDAYLSVFCVFFCFFFYLLAAFVFYGRPALLTFGFSGNLAVLLLVL